MRHDIFWHETVRGETIPMGKWPIFPLAPTLRSEISFVPQVFLVKDRSTGPSCSSQSSSCVSQHLMWWEHAKPPRDGKQESLNPHPVLISSTARSSPAHLSLVFPQGPLLRPSRVALEFGHGAEFAVAPSKTQTTSPSPRQEVSSSLGCLAKSEVFLAAAPVALPVLPAPAVLRGDRWLAQRCLDSQTN